MCDGGKIVLCARYRAKVILCVFRKADPPFFPFSSLALKSTADPDVKDKSNKNHARIYTNSNIFFLISLRWISAKVANPPTSLPLFTWSIFFLPPLVNLIGGISDPSNESVTKGHVY